jgi:hypothetical protein
MIYDHVPGSELNALCIWLIYINPQENSNKASINNIHFVDKDTDIEKI